MFKYLGGDIVLKVLLVDDEPYILQGLRVLVDWEEEGFKITGMAANGQEALKFLKNNKVDLILADIKMPIMNGLELLARIRNDDISDAYFIILSGYADFLFAQEAIRYDCTDYILKPVSKEQLIDTLHKVKYMKVNVEEEEQKSKEMKQAYIARNLIAIIKGKFDKYNLKHVEENMELSEKLRYIEIVVDYLAFQEELTDEDKRMLQRKLHKSCQKLLKRDKGHCVFDVSGDKNIYDIGFLYCDYMAADKGLNENTYLKEFSRDLEDILSIPIIMLVGKKVTSLSNVTKSYHTVAVLRSLQGFRSKKRIYYYENEVQVNGSSVIICKKSLDKLLASVEENNQDKIEECVNSFYDEMKKTEITGETMMLNINYLLFQMIHIASQQDDELNQSEIMREISLNTHKKGIKQGSKEHLSSLASEYARYLAQLRRNTPTGVLAKVEKEIKENYSKNLTLKELGEKYYVNSAYLGQLFRKEFGISFKDYLINYRMETAAKLLIRTNNKTTTIAEKVGYCDVDYFVNRFVLAKGCTPAKYRKRSKVQQ